MRLYLLILFMLISFYGIAQEHQDAQKQNVYHLSLNSYIRNDLADKIQVISGETKYIYNIILGDTQETYFLNSLSVKIKTDGKTTLDTYKSLNRIKSIDKDDTIEFYLGEDDGNDELRKMYDLYDQFAKPLCKLKYDNKDKLIERIENKADGAKILVDNGIIDNVLLFHVRIPEGSDLRSYKRKLSLGDKRYAKGYLDWELESEKDSKKTYNITGCLTKEEIEMPLCLMKNLIYNVNGKQIFDTQKNKWILGFISIDTSFQLVRDGKTISKSKGVMTLNLQTKEIKDKVEIHLQKADELAAQKKYKEAATLYSEINQFSPWSSEAHYGKGIALFMQRDMNFKFKGALSSFTKAIEINPIDADSYLKRAFIRASRTIPDNPIGAIEDFNMVISLNPETKGVYLLRGMAYQRIDYFNKALIDLNHHMNKNPKDSKGLYYRGLINIDLKDFESAISDLDKAIDISNKDYMKEVQREAYLSLAEKHEAENKPEEAKRVYKILLKKYEGSKEAQKANERLKDLNP